MTSNDIELKSGSNLRKGLSKQWLRHKCIWSMIALVASVLTLGVCLETFAESPDAEQTVVQYATNFSIIKAEGRESDQVYVAQ